MAGTARQILGLSSGIAWARFDPAFYARIAPDLGGLTDPAALLEHYFTIGAPLGLSPNRWFDEAWYRASRGDVDVAVRSGGFASAFDHYCQYGYEDCSPHWLFSTHVYQVENPGLTPELLREAGFANSYDHYLKFGAAEARLAHELFDPHIYAAQLDPQEAGRCAEIGAFKHFLAADWRRATEEPRTARGFDPVWYRDAYLDADSEIRQGAWHSALHHYLWHRASGGYDPVNPASAPAPVSDVAAAAVAPRIKINIDLPVIRNREAMEPVHGHLEIVGWAAANHAVVGVDVFVDDEWFGQAHHGMRTEEVAAAFPELTHGMFAGLRFIATTPLSAGRHHARIVARGETGLEASEEFAFEVKPLTGRDGPGSLRSRMRHGEIAFKLGLLENAGMRPFFAVIVRSGAAAEARQRTLDSLHRQVYPRWTVHDTAAPASHADDIWFIQLDPGDELGVDALLELALHRLVDRDADFLYSDERRIDPASGDMAPFFKPQWSPDLLLSMNYVGRLWAASAPLLRKAGLADRDVASLDGYDLALRLTEHAEHIGHVPHMLCESATAGQDDPTAERAALEAALRRRGIAGDVLPGCLPHVWRVRREVLSPPSVSVIIPTAWKNGLVDTALRTLRECTDYPAVEVIVLDTAPGRSSTDKQFVRAAADRIIEDASPFNWSRLNNRAASVARGALLLFLNDDVAFTDPGWLRAMVEHAQREEVGIVGPLLLYPDGLVQHAGMRLSRSGGQHVFHGQSGSAPGPFGLAMTQRNVIAVTGACMLVRRAVFERLGGFDERFDVSNNDLNFCLRSHQAGLLTVYTPHARLTHHESITRAGVPDDHNSMLFGEVWRDRLAAGDPFFNRNLSLGHIGYREDVEPVQIVHPQRPMALAATVRRILVIKLDHVGDFILSLPAIRRLKEHFADATVTLLAAPASCDLAAIEPAIDEAIPFRFFEQRSALGLRAPGPGELDACIATLRARSFDLALDMRCHGETRHLLQESGATWRAGFDTAFEFPWLDIAAVAEPDTHQQAKRRHMADTLADFVASICAAFPREAPPRKPRADAVWPDRVPPPPPECGLRIVVHPGCGTPIKQWPIRHFAALIGQLAAAFDCWVVLIGSPDETELADRILAMLDGQSGVANAVGRTDYRDLVQLIGACDLFIGSDSGPRHIADAADIPSIGIFSGNVDSVEWGPSSASAVGVRRRMVCSPCYIALPEDCPRATACMTDLEPASVMDLVRKMVAGRRPKQRVAVTA